MPTMIDPVCGMTVDPEKARGGSFEHAGTTYYFCSPGCRTKFAADPDGWLQRGPKGMGSSTTHNLQLTTSNLRAKPRPADSGRAELRTGKGTPDPERWTRD